MKKATNKLFGYECTYEVCSGTNVVLFWVNDKRQIWLGIDDFFKNFKIIQQ